MKKKFLRMAAFLTVVLLLMSVPAFAANTVDYVGNEISSSTNVTVFINTTGLDENDDITVLVFKAEGENPQPDENNIAYINQVDFVSGQTSISFPMPEDADGLYEVRIGGTDVESYTSGRFSITHTILGDVNKDGKIDTKDAIVVLRVYLSSDDIDVDITTETYDVNKDGSVDTKDAIWILRQYLSAD